MEQNKSSINIFRAILKAGILFALFNFAFIFVKPEALGQLSLYNKVFPGRERFPFGETRESYNISLYNLDAMFASHIISGTKKAPDEYRVILIGDSSVWGTLLTPEQTLAGQLNANSITACNKNVRTYNLGYPTISLTKDLMLFDQALQYQPDMVVVLTTLESMPRDKQLTSPLVANNAERVRQLIFKYELNADTNDPVLVKPSKWEQTFVSQRRNIADLLRLQIDGALWASTGIDQVYPEKYERAQTDLGNELEYHGLIQKSNLRDALALDVLDAMMSATQVPTLLVNEPILISQGINSDLRYNFFYPRWAYDEYRNVMNEYTSAHDKLYLDLWDILPPSEFTNSAIHLTPHGESLLASKIAEAIQIHCK
ncbi:MAG: SGNH/GDSL hydrolase family protein [Anaerolineales bacterium]|nr:SGNH/GDSL hydrolase family protein [Anaerolineales bacterium]